jgi:hypothetical protein
MASSSRSANRSARQAFIFSNSAIDWEPARSATSVIKLDRDARLRRELVWRGQGSCWPRGCRDRGGLGWVVDELCGRAFLVFLLHSGLVTSFRPAVLLEPSTQLACSVPRSIRATTCSRSWEQQNLLRCDPGLLVECVSPPRSHRRDQQCRRLPSRHPLAEEAVYVNSKRTRHARA